MIQQIIIYILLVLACVYIFYIIYRSLKKESACGSCSIMKAAKESIAEKQRQEQLPIK
ncbi:MAG: FeoB-associated Cys-rich membrane protein [Bacteroidia bacterium]